MYLIYNTMLIFRKECKLLNILSDKPGFPKLLYFKKDDKYILSDINAFFM